MLIPFNNCCCPDEEQFVIHRKAHADQRPQERSWIGYGAAVALAMLVMVGVLALAGNARGNDTGPPAYQYVEVGPPPDTYRPTSLPTAACQCKPCQCEECGCKPVKGERLPESPYKVAVAKYVQPRPVYRQPACYGARCYVPQRRSGIFGWRRR